MDDLNRLAATLQDLLTEVADRLAADCGFIRRRRKLTGPHFAQAVVFSALAHSDVTAGRLRSTAAAVGLRISRQSLDERFTTPAAEFLKRLLAEATARMIASPVAIPLLRRFATVEVLDSSIVALPAELGHIYRGGRSGTTSGATAAVKLTVGLDLKTGALRGPELDAGRAADLGAELATTAPPRGGRGLADLNYFDTAKFARWAQAGAYFLSRLKVRTAVHDPRGHRLDLLKAMRDAGDRDIDRDVELGGRGRVPCRLLARRVPPEVAALRRRRLREKSRRRGDRASELALALCDWTVLVTNVPRGTLSVEEAVALARMRWQIELVFKLWKSHGGIDEWNGTRPAKVLCAVYGKLLAMVVEHWAIVTGCWSQPDRSPSQAAWVVRAFALSLAVATRDLESLVRVLGHVMQVMEMACRMETKGSRSANRRILRFGEEP